MGEFDGAFDDIFGGGGGATDGKRFRRRKRERKRRARAEAAAGTAGLVDSESRRRALQTLDLRGCGLVTGILVVLAVIAVVVATSGGDDEPKEAADSRQPSAQGPSGDREEPSAASDEIQYFAITFTGGGDRPNVPGATCPVQEPGEIRVTSGDGVELYLGWSAGNPLGRPVGTLYPSGASRLGEDGTFEYVVEGGAGIEVNGQVDGEQASGTMAWYVEDPPDTWCRYDFSGTAIEAADAREVIPE